VIAAMVAMLMGAAILFVTGFSSNDFLHSAAHDVRHSSGFPCH
jgi:cobalt transporter subunit CbtB